MQAVYFVMVWFFVSCIGFVRGCFFCHGVGFPQWQLYAAVFLVRGGLRKRKPFVLSRCFFLQAVLGSFGAVCFVMVWWFPSGSCTRLCFWFGAVCVSACRLFCRGVFFCKRYWFLAVRFVLSSGGFPQAVLVPCGAFCFVVGWVFPGGSCTRLYLAGFVLLVVLCGSCVCCSGRFA